MFYEKFNWLRLVITCWNGRWVIICVHFFFRPFYWFHFFDVYVSQIELRSSSRFYYITWKTFEKSSMNRKTRNSLLMLSCIHRRLKIQSRTAREEFSKYSDLRERKNIDFLLKKRDLLLPKRWVRFGAGGGKLMTKTDFKTAWWRAKERI